MEKAVTMQSLQEILKSKIKPKEKMTLLAETIKTNPALLDDIISQFPKLSDGDKGNCLSAMQAVSLENIDIILPYSGFIIKCLDTKGNRIRWEAAETVGNIARKHLDKVIGAIPAILKLTTDEGTVVRWSGAKALCEIAIADTENSANLIPKLKAMAAKEENSGVKKTYLKTLKTLGIK
jgi:hypothetical protein